jgi:Tfp pilus assembly protein PilO
VNRRVLIVSAVASLAMVGLWYLFLWSPRQSELRTERARTAAALAQKATLETRLGQLQDLKKREPLRRAQLERLRIAIPDRADLAAFILDANSAADDAGIDFLSITPSAPSAATQTAPGTVGLSMTVSGPYSDVLDYLTKLQDLPRIVVVDTLNLAPAGVPDPSGSTRLSVSVTGKMFLAGDAPATTSPASTSPAAPAAASAAAGTAAGAAAPAPAPGPAAIGAGPNGRPLPAAPVTPPASTTAGAPR